MASFVPLLLATLMTQNMTTCVARSMTSQAAGSRLLRLLAVCVLLCSCVVLTACGSGADEGAVGGKDDGKVMVVVSIPPLASLIRPMLADWGRVESLLPAGASVHGHDPSSHQMQLASKAAVLVVVGRNLDGWAERLTEQAAGKRKIPVITFAQMNDGNRGLNQNVHDDHDDHGDHSGHDRAGHDDHAGHDHTGLNPHLWLDPVITSNFIKWITPQIEKLAPGDDARAATSEASSKLINELASLDEQYKTSLGQLERKDMVTFHNAFDLLAVRYGLNVAAHLTDVELAPGGEVTASQLIETIQTIRKFKLKVVYAEPQFPDRATQVITQETGANILRLDPLGGRGLKGYETYFEMMDSNLKVLLQGQRIP